MKESPREQKSKKYSDTRKERTKLDVVKSEKPIGSKPEVKLAKSMNDDDIKPFTQLPQVKTDDLTKLIEEMDRKVKLDELQADGKVFKEKNIPDAKILSKKKDTVVKPDDNRLRRNSLDSGEVSPKEESQMKRQNSLGDRSKSTDREDSEEKERSEGNDRPERRIRNKVLYSFIICSTALSLLLASLLLTHVTNFKSLCLLNNSLLTYIVIHKYLQILDIMQKKL